jgi:hypothetical protein
MKKRVADQLKEMGFTGSVETFRQTLAEVKTEKYPDMTDEDLAFTKNQAGDYCAEVNRRLGGTKLARVFILRALVGLRKNGGAKKKAVASLQDGQATT